MQMPHSGIFNTGEDGQIQKIISMTAKLTVLLGCHNGVQMRYAIGLHRKNPFL